MINNQNILQNLTIRVNDIIDRIDVFSAGKLLREFRQLSPDQKNVLGNQLNNLANKLRAVNFLSLSDKEAVDMIKNHILLFFQIDIPLEQRLVARYSFQGTTEKNNQREILKSAILENGERLGNLTIGEWIKKFDGKYDINDREEQSTINFFSEDAEASRLNEQEQFILKKILHVYDTLLASELMDIFDAAAVIQTLENKYGDTDVPIELSSFSSQFSKVPKNDINSRIATNDSIIKLTLSEAMKQIPELGEQLITFEKIKLRSFPEPVRPSIKNWLADYTFTIGFDNKDSIKRGNYLFHNTNTNRLSSDDRQRLAYILKANDEKTPVMVNKDLKQIVFQAPETSTSSQPKARLFEPRQENSLKPSFGSSPQSSASLHNTISYSSPQKMSYEKTTQTPVKSVQDSPAPQVFNRVIPQATRDEAPQVAKFPYYQQPRQTTPTNNVVRLAPKPEPPKELPKNVVNLRDNF